MLRALPAARWRCLRFFSRRAFSFPAHEVITMPALSPTMEKGTLVSWTVTEGGSFGAGDVLCEVETDKATVAFECQDDGYLAKQLVSEGTRDLAVGAPIGVSVEDEGDVAAFASYTIADAGGAADAAPAAPKESATPAAPTPAEPSKPAEEPSRTPSIKFRHGQQDSAPAAVASDGSVRASPMARAIAREMGIDLGTLAGKGSGPGGRIVAEDLDVQPRASAGSAGGLGTPIAEMPPRTNDYTDVPIDGMRETIGARLLQSKQQIPHFYETVECEMDALLEARQEMNRGLESGKISVNDLIVKATALALRDVPEVNASWLGEKKVIRQFQYIDVSVAVAIDGGLITPIVTDADKKGLKQISESVRDLASRARDRKLQPHEYQGGTFTISNLGMFGVKHFTAIINPPQSAILAVGATDKVVKPNDKTPGGVRTANVMCVTLASDHRVVDGALAAQWLRAFKGYIENPLRLTY